METKNESNHLLNVISAQRNEAMDRHAQAVAQINIFMEAAAEREKELQATVKLLSAQNEQLKVDGQMNISGGD